MKITFDENGNGTVSEINGDYDLPTKRGGIHATRFELKNGKVVDKHPTKSDEELIAEEQAAVKAHNAKLVKAVTK